MPAPISPGDLDGVVGRPAAPFHVLAVSQVVTKLGRVPPIPQVRPRLPPMFRIDLHQDWRVRPLSSRQENLQGRKGGFGRRAKAGEDIITTCGFDFTVRLSLFPVGPVPAARKPPSPDSASES